MKVSQALTASALLLFLVGNYLYIMKPVSPQVQALVSTNQLTQQQLLEAESAVRQLQSEMATTNALLDRKSISWENDPASIRVGLRGNGPNKHVAEMRDELVAQTKAVASRINAIDKDLNEYSQRISHLEVSKSNGKESSSLSDKYNDVADVVAKPSVAPPPPPPPLPPATSSVPPLGADSPVLMICFQRADYLERSLNAIKKHHPGNGGVPIIISQDGANADVIRVIEKFKTDMKIFDQSVSVVHIQHKQGGGDGYHKLAQHYGWALNQVFSNLPTLVPILPPPARVIILEEDLEVAPDFFDYLAATAPYLDDPFENLLAVSAWNDNGQGPHVADNKAIYRSSFFPGLGWMLNRRIWTELSNKWPQGYWDDWLREPAQQAGREILRPEICRTYHFAKKGVSNNQYSDFLTTIKLNMDPVSWRSMDLSYLKRSAYNAALRRELETSPMISLAEAKAGRFPAGDGPVRVEYASVRSFEGTARRLGIMDNVKAGVPRCAYHGVVTVRLGAEKRKVHVTLPLNKVDL